MSELPRKAPDRVNTFGVVLIGLVAAVLLWVSVVALQAYYYGTAGKLESERGAAGKSREVRDLKAQQRAELAEGKYVDAKKGIVTIPIDDAMKLVLHDAKAGAPSLVPAIGAHDQPTVPAVSGRPPDNVQPPTAPGGATEGVAAPAGGGAAPAPAPAAGSAPAPAAGSTPAPAAGSTPAPAAGSAPTPAAAGGAPAPAAEGADTTTPTGGPTATPAPSPPAPPSNP
jgi:hypothetical protein